VVNPADDVSHLPQNCPNHDARPAATDVKRWRQAQRERLIRERLAISADERRKHAAQIAARLDDVVGQISGRTVSAYAHCAASPICAHGWSASSRAVVFVHCLSSLSETRH